MSADRRARRPRQFRQAGRPAGHGKACAQCVAFQSVKDGTVIRGVSLEDLLFGSVELADKDDVVFGSAQRITVALAMPGRDRVAYTVMLPDGHPCTREALLVYVGQFICNDQIALTIAAEWGDDWQGTRIMIMGAHWCGDNRWRVDLEHAPDPSGK